MKPIDVRYNEGGTTRRLAARPRGNQLLVAMDGAAEVAVSLSRDDSGGWVLQTPEGRSRVHIVVDGQRILICHRGVVHEFRADDPARSSGPGAGDREVRAPMTGKVVDVAVKAGDQVEAGATLVVLEAMKMEHRMKATAAMTVVHVHAERGGLVELGALLVTLEPRDKP